MQTSRERAYKETKEVIMKTSFLKIGLVGLVLTLAVSTFAKAKEKPPTNVISMDVARKTATDSMPGTVQKEELEREHGKWLYSFDLKSVSDSKVHEVQVDAISGKLVSTKAEADDEANEHEDEANEND